jgi:hypothetical protein
MAIASLGFSHELSPMTIDRHSVPKDMGRAVICFFGRKKRFKLITQQLDLAKRPKLTMLTGDSGPNAICGDKIMFALLPI